ncbi:MAG: hypothetical protein HC842_04550, partial [Cytophagales bacterium]|nr:hypothetical protein [Cytophagales bacterium]
LCIADFLELHDWTRPVKIECAREAAGHGPGRDEKAVRLVLKQRKIQLKALPKDMPDTVEVDISALDLGKSIKVSALEGKGYEILTNPNMTLASVEIPRACAAKPKARRLKPLLFAPLSFIRMQVPLRKGWDFFAP